MAMRNREDDGMITKVVTVKGLKVSASAQAKIEAAGGKVE